jgi:chromosome partitioning protein
MALPGVDRVLTSVETLKKHLNEELEVTGILACRVDPRTRHSREVVKELRSRYGNLVFATEVRENVRLAEAPAAGLPINLYDTRSKGALDYRALANEVMAQED